jgi:hypothetical protein
VIGEQLMVGKKMLFKGLCFRVSSIYRCLVIQVFLPQYYISNFFKVLKTFFWPSTPPNKLGMRNETHRCIDCVGSWERSLELG